MDRRQPTDSDARLNSGAPSASRGRLEIIIAIALGLAAVVIAGAVYLNEHQEHKANLDSTRPPTGWSMPRPPESAPPPAARSKRLRPADRAGREHQDKAANYTLAEVILGDLPVPVRRRRDQLALAHQDRRRSPSPLACSWSPWSCWRRSRPSGGR